MNRIVKFLLTGLLYTHISLTSCSSNSTGTTVGLTASQTPSTNNNTEATVESFPDSTTLNVNSIVTSANNSSTTTASKLVEVPSSTTAGRISVPETEISEKVNGSNVNSNSSSGNSSITQIADLSTGEGTTTPGSGYRCAKGTPDAHKPTNCSEPCFGVFTNGRSFLGCHPYLNITIGYRAERACGQHLKRGLCMKAVVAGESKEACLKCCEGHLCNLAFSKKCDYIPSDPSCTGAGVSFASSSVLISLVFCVLFAV